VVVLEIAGKPDINDPPEIKSDDNIFIDYSDVRIASNRENVDVRYTLDGTPPLASSPKAIQPVRLTETTTVSARCFRAGKPVSGTAQSVFKKVSPQPSVIVKRPAGGIRFDYFEGTWDSLPDFSILQSAGEGVVPNFTLPPDHRPEYFGFEYSGFVSIPSDGVYTFSTSSDDGSRLYIGGLLVVDNDRLHGMTERQGVVALAGGMHPVRLLFFQKTGDIGLTVSYRSRNITKSFIPDNSLFHQE
jgi:hypothetical protein